MLPEALRQALELVREPRLERTALEILRRYPNGWRILGCPCSMCTTGANEPAQRRGMTLLLSILDTEQCQTLLDAGTFCVRGQHDRYVFDVQNVGTVHGDRGVSYCIHPSFADGLIVGDVIAATVLALLANEELWRVTANIYNAAPPVRARNDDQYDAMRYAFERGIVQPERFRAEYLGDAVLRRLRPNARVNGYAIAPNPVACICNQCNEPVYEVQQDFNDIEINVFGAGRIAPIPPPPVALPCGHIRGVTVLAMGTRWPG